MEIRNGCMSVWQSTHQQLRKPAYFANCHGFICEDRKQLAKRNVRFNIRYFVIVAKAWHMLVLLDNVGGDGRSDGGVDGDGCQRQDQQGFEVRGPPTAVLLVASIGKRARQPVRGAREHPDVRDFWTGLIRWQTQLIVEWEHRGTGALWSLQSTKRSMCLQLQSAVAGEISRWVDHNAWQHAASSTWLPVDFDNLDELKRKAVET